MAIVLTAIISCIVGACLGIFVTSMCIVGSDKDNNK